MPKSASFAPPSPGGTMTLPGLTSRCTMPTWWAARSASSSCRPMAATSAAGSGPRSRTTSARVGASTSSITMKVRSSSRTTS